MISIILQLGEAGVHYFHASGSEFDEMFVGSGSRKVRQLFGKLPKFLVYNFYNTCTSLEHLYVCVCVGGGVRYY
jgi:hypothetical protein